MTKILIQTLCIFSIAVSAHAKREIIKISDLNITTNKENGMTLGKISATDLNVDFGGNEFQAQDNGNLLKGNVEIKDQQFSAKVSFVTYKTNLALDNPLVTLDHLFLKDALINFDRKEMFFEAPYIKTGTEDTTVSAKRLKGSCDPKGDASTDIDIVCLNNGVLESEQAQLINQTMNILTNNTTALISPEAIAIDASKIIFTSNGGKTQVEKLKADCSNGIKTRFNIDDFIEGCLQQAHIFLDDFSEFNEVPKIQLENKALVDLEDIKFIKVNIKDSYFDIRSRIKIFFKLNLKVNGKMEHNQENHILKINVVRASIAGIPAKTLTLMILKLFLEEDSIKIEGDTIYIAL
mgnify:CR=1 FL=1